MSNENTKFSETATIIKYNQEDHSMSNDGMKWSCKMKIEKYNNDESYDKGVPDDVLNVIGNTALYTGLELLWKLASGLGDDSTNYFLNKDNTFIGVGNSSATAQPTQTGLVGTSTEYKEMDQSTGTEYPIIDNNVMTFRSKFGPTDGNFAWNEWGIINGNPNDLGSRDPSTVVQMNRKVEPMGTKVAGSTWVIVCDITINP